MTKIIFHLNTIAYGGVERVVSNLANRFAEMNFDVVITTQWHSDIEFALDPRVRRVHVGLLPIDEKSNRLSKILIRLKYLRAFIKSEKPDIMIAFDRNANYRALLASMGTVTPVIISVRNPPQIYYSSMINRIIVALLFPRAAGCVFQTSGQRDFFAKKIQRKSRIILNPLHEKYLGISPPSERKKEIVNSSRLEGYKNQAGIINAFIRLHHDYPDYILKIYGGDHGDGTKEILEGIISKHKAGDYVKLMGASDSLEKDIVNASIYVFNSDREGLPNVLMEAMALGLPVISTDCPCGGPAALINDGVSGLLIPVGDEEALCNALRRLLDNPQYAESLGREARKIGEVCNINTITAQWLDYIRCISHSE